MTHFKKHREFNYRFLVYRGTMWILYPYTPPREYAFERGFKYSLCFRFYSDTDGAYRTVERCRVKSIKEAEKWIKGRFCYEAV